RDRNVTGVQTCALPICMGMVGSDMGKFIQYQTGQAIPEMAKGAASGGGGIAGDAMGLGAGLAMGQVLAQNLQKGLAGGAASNDEIGRASCRERVWTGAA